jgi:VWFA-related protein
VLVFTDGMDNPGREGGLNQSLRDVMRRSQEEDMMVYAIGLMSSVPAFHGRPFGGGMRFPGGGFGGGFGGGRRGGGRGGQPQKPDPGLAKLAAESGGGYFELQSTADLASTFARVADELHHQYALGFTPEKLDGKTHKLDVRLKQPGMTARARKSYVASPERG